MNAKTIMTLVVAGALATATFADEVFDSLVKLANTPKEQITAENAPQILDAAIATTNSSAMYRLIDSKTTTYAKLFEKLKNNHLWFYALRDTGIKVGTNAEKAAAFQNFVDTWIALDDEELQAKYVSSVFVNWSVIDYKNKIYMPVSEIEAACAKVAASSSKLKANALASMLYIYGSSYWQGRLDSACEQYFGIVSDSILNGDFREAYQVFDVVRYVIYTRKDHDLASRLLDNIKWFVNFADSKRYCPFLTNYSKNFEPTLSALRKQYLASYAKNDFQLTTVALAQDKIDGTKEATKSIYSKLKDTSVKLDTALYLNDNDKLIDILMIIDNSIAPEKIEKAIVIINTFDPDFRAADVLKALRVINKKYTLKLYDDRDTWEPILSKVRALIDTYNN